MNFPPTEKSWYKLRCYLNGFNGQNFPDLRHRWLSLWSEYDRTQPTQITFLDWVQTQFPNSRTFTDIQLNCDGLEFKTVEDKEAFITWVLLADK